MAAHHALSVARLLAAVLAVALVLPAGAQDDKRTREALRRAQQALQAAQAERDTLQQDKARLEQQKQQDDQALAAAQAQQKQADAQHARLAAGLASAKAEHDHAQAELEAERQASAQRQQQVEALQASLAQAEARGADQRRTTLALRGLLERSVQSLADNERQNRQLYDVGQRAVADYQQCQEHGSSSPDGNLLGLGTVRTTSVAEQLKREMDAVAAPATLAPSAAAR